MNLNVDFYTTAGSSGKLVISGYAGIRIEQLMLDTGMSLPEVLEAAIYELAVKVGIEKTRRRQ